MVKASDKTNGAAGDCASQGSNISQECCQAVDDKVKYYRRGKNMGKPIEHETIMAAYHEAGHAVVAAIQWIWRKNGCSCRQAVPFRYVTLRPKKHGKYKGYIYESGGRVVLSGKYRSRLHLIVLFAGALSEIRVQPERWLEHQNGCTIDLLNCLQLLESLKIGDDEIDDIVSQSGDEVIRGWPAIDAVAQDLLDKGTLTWREVDERCWEYEIRRNIWSPAKKQEEASC